MSSNLMLGQARCAECGVSLDGIQPHEKDCTYPRRQAELMRGMQFESYAELLGYKPGMCGWVDPFTNTVTIYDWVNEDEK
jgi:hypothetical protein